MGIDMVINLAYVKSGDYAALKDEVAGVVQASAPAIVKVILETPLLLKEEKVLAAQAAAEAGRTS